MMLFQCQVTSAIISKSQNKFALGAMLTFVDGYLVFKLYVHTMWPWNLTDDLEKQKGTSSMLLQALCIISEPLVY